MYVWGLGDGEGEGEGEGDDERRKGRRKIEDRRFI